MAVYEIPLSPSVAQSFRVTISANRYKMRVIYADAPEAGWLIDISDTDGNPIACGLPLVTGADLLEQLEYLGIGASLAVATDGDPDAVPTFASLGDTSHLYMKVA